MSYSYTEDTATRNALNNAYAALCDAGSYFLCKAGSTVLSTIPLNSSQRWDASVAGVMTLHGLPLIDPVPDNLGTLDNFELYNSSNVRIATGNITATGGGGAMTVDNTVIGAGDAVIITGFTRTQPAS